MIEKAELWFASADSFNDPFDSVLQYDFDSFDPELTVKLAAGVVAQNHPHFSQAQRNAEVEKCLEEFKADPIAYLTKFRKASIDINYKRLGICSLTPVPYNLLMWAHYAKDHTGFCVGLDMNSIEALQEEQAIRDDDFSIHKITYAKQMPRIDFLKSMTTDSQVNDMINLLTTKSDDWEYEDEYRFIRWDGANSSLSIGESCLAAIILGYRIERENRDRIIATVKAMRRSIPVYQATPEDYKFSLRIEPISIA
jgi:hypothetical protein